MKFIGRVLGYIDIYISLVIIFLLSLFISSLIPSKYIEDNVRESSEILNVQSNRYYVKDVMATVFIDNFTDALMLNTAYSIDYNDPFYSFLVARKNYIPGKNIKVYSDDVGELKSSSFSDDLDQVGDLDKIVNGDVTESFEYARYWHGYLAFLRPLLIFFNISQIRIINVCLFILLAIVLLCLILKKIGFIETLIVLFAFIGIDYLHIGLSLQGTPLFLLMMIFSIYILFRYEKIKNIYPLFFVVGGICSFVDFLTVPILTLGFPMTLYFLLEQKHNDISFVDVFKKIFFICLNWALGYLIIMFTKWIIVDLIYNKGLIITSLNQLLYRIGNTFMPSIIDTLKYNIIMVFLDFSFCIMICIVIFSISILINKFEFKFSNVFPYLFICILPFVWYIFLRNHSYGHYLFTYRNLMLFLLNLPLVFFKLIKK